MYQSGRACIESTLHVITMVENQLFKLHINLKRIGSLANETHPYVVIAAAAIIMLYHSAQKSATVSPPKMNTNGCSFMRIRLPTGKLGQT